MYVHYLVARNMDLVVLVESLVDRKLSRLDETLTLGRTVRALIVLDCTKEIRFCCSDRARRSVDKTL